MDATVTENLETSNMEVPLPEVPPKDEVLVEMGVPERVNSADELIQSDKNVSSDKELSWEKIAAEIAAEDVDSVENGAKPEENQTQLEVNLEPPVVRMDVDPLESEKMEITADEETVISTVTEEKTVTESETSVEVIEDSTEPPKEEIIVEPPPIIEPEPVIEPLTEELNEQAEPLEEEAPDQETSIPVDEVMEVQESVEAEENVSLDVQQPEEVAEPAALETPEIKAPTLEAPKEAEIEITELKPEEVPEIPEEVVEDIEYTVVETDEVETNEIIEEHLAQTNNTTTAETVVIINPDQTQTEITIEHIDDDEKDDENPQTYTEKIYVLTKESDDAVDDPVEEAEVKEVKPKKQRGRKPIADIPLHVLGRDITKPSEGVSNGGRTMPKPRLGVKVPYRNLTSQIVSKEEIEKEIMERFKLKQEQNATNSGDILFARKLTQRLAKKLIPNEKEKSPGKVQEASSSVENDGEIKNNSDLIAILEGEGDDIDITKQQALEAERKEVSRKKEKEIALQQLKELPGKNRIFKSRGQGSESEGKVSSPVKEVSKTKTPTPSSQKSSVEKKIPVEVEPSLKTGMVIKTYTRKRKSTDLESFLPPKKAVVVATAIKSEDGGASTNVYITKSSRIIKRKVIWDPDEVQTKSPIRSPKPETIKSSKPDSVKSPKLDTVKSPKPDTVKSSKPDTVKPPKPDSIKSPKSDPPAKPSVKPAQKKEVGEKIPERKIPVPIKKPISKTPPLKKPKRLTEVDKLLMDEGAVKMLYDVKTNDDTSPEKQKKKANISMISLDRAHRELMSKTNVIKNDLQQNTNKDMQKSLRKKEVLSPPKKDGKKEATPSGVTRKRSKDSVRSSLHSPPSSPAYIAAEASRIIRRHSSSSFSSNDDSSDEDGEERVTRKKAGGALESAKKKMKKTSEAKPAKEKDAAKNNNSVSETKTNHVDKSGGHYKTFTMSKRNKLVSIKLISVDSRCYLNEQVLKELTACLKDLAKDDDCHVVSVISDTNESFCDGLDYRALTADDDSARKKKATELASLVKDFLRCLLNFPKVLVAGVQGECVGLGVTMLPLFDMVIASDTSTFSAPYAKLGCIPEAGFLLSVPHLNSTGLASELFYASQTVKADDAFRRGLVTRLCWPEKYQQELKSMLSHVAGQSRQSIVATKQQLRQNILQSTEAALSSISKNLVEHWISAECQKNFSK